jgi:rubrerythrin
MTIPGPFARFSFGQADALLGSSDAWAIMRADQATDQADHPSSAERFLRLMESHIQGEEASIGAYAQLAEQSQDAVIALVMRMVMDDEDRHHTLLRQIAASLRDALQWTASPDALPTAYQPAAAATQSLVATAKELIAEELNGARLMRTAAAEQRSLDGGLVSLLLEAIAHDSEKHARLIHFVQRRMEERLRRQRTG